MAGRLKRLSLMAKSDAVVAGPPLPRWRPPSRPGELTIFGDETAHVQRRQPEASSRSSY
jgi:hypothetical protein